MSGLSKKAIAEIEEKIGYSFKNKGLLIQAFARRSFIHERRQAGKNDMQSNEVLEFLGDSVLGCSVAKRIVVGYSNIDATGMHSRLDEGKFTVTKSHLSDKRMLSERMTELGFAKYLLLGEGDKKSNIQEQPSVREDLFESIVGAIFLDSGCNFNVADEIVCKMLDIDEFFRNNYQKNPKSILQEYAQAFKLKFSYIDRGMRGPDNATTYFRAVMLDGNEYPTASGKSIRAAEMAAAEIAIKELKLL